METIICSAILYLDGERHEHQPKGIELGFVVAGRRHHNCLITTSILTQKCGENGIKKLKQIQGFITSEDRFVDRKDAARIAIAAGQVTELIRASAGELDSSDLYKNTQLGSAENDKKVQRYYNIIGGYSGLVIGRTTDIESALRKEPSATFKEITKEEFEKE